MPGMRPLSLLALALALALAGFEQAGTAGAFPAPAGSAPDRPYRLCSGLTVTILGTERNDRITGSSGPDVIATGAGDDRIHARGGNDVVCAGQGDDTISSGSGKDEVAAMAGDDVLDGQLGGDVLEGGPGADELNGGDGRDRANGGGGDDWCHGAEQVARCADRRALLRVPGETPRAGPRRGPGFRYQVFVEEAIGESPERVAGFIDGALSDSRGWTASRAISVRRVERRPNTRIILATPETVDRLCYPLPTRGRVSCNQGNDVVLNIDRWRWAFQGWTGTRRQYKLMLVNHETGHRYGLGHQPCEHPGAKASVMQQQTFDLQGCRAAWWPKQAELKRLRATTSPSRGR